MLLCFQNVIYVFKKLFKLSTLSFKRGRKREEKKEGGEETARARRMMAGRNCLNNRQLACDSTHSSSSQLFHSSINLLAIAFYSIRLLNLIRWRIGQSQWHLPSFGSMNHLIYTHLSYAQSQPSLSTVLMRACVRHLKLGNATSGQT